jgi:hypothetical protein
METYGQLFDVQQTHTHLKGTSITKMFQYHGDFVSDFCRYIRLSQTRKDSSGVDHLGLNNIEFVGSITNAEETRAD